MNTERRIGVGNDFEVTEDDRWEIFRPYEKNSRAKVFVNEALRTTTVVYPDTEYDALDYISRRSGQDNFNIHMPNKIVATVHTHEEDMENYSIEEGIRQAFRKADRKHQKAMKNAIRAWMKHSIKEMCNVDKELFKETAKEKLG